jgi:hypothetical protein
MAIMFALVCYIPVLVLVAPTILFEINASEPMVNAFVSSTLKHSSTLMNTGMNGRNSSPQRLHIERFLCTSALKVTNRNGDYNSNPYDLSKPIYDLYSFRMVRGDALVQYNIRNQSEPLRINLAIIGACFLMSLPLLISEFSGMSGGNTVIPTTMPLVTPHLTVTIPQTIISWIGGVGCCVIGIQEARKRNRQLLRLEKECAACDLHIQLPMVWIGSDRPYQAQSESIRNVILKKSCRVIAMSGPSNQLHDILENELRIYNRRWIQSNTYWILIPTSIIDSKDRSSLFSQSRYSWLAQASDLDAWNTYFQNLKSPDQLAASAASSEPVSWFGLSATGRSFGSGSSRPTSYLQLLGNSLSPVDILSNDDEGQNAISPSGTDESSENTTQNLLMSCQQRFYDALTDGNLDKMQSDVFMTDTEEELDEAVTGVVKQGGRLDKWETCLMPDAKPAGMTVSDREVIQLNDGVTAYTTCIEFPMDTYNGGVSPTLLAVQKWKRVIPSEVSSIEKWKLLQHQTIPWTSDRPAGGTLICDCRGCVALVRSTSTSKR